MDERIPIRRHGLVPRLASIADEPGLASLRPARSIPLFFPARDTGFEPVALGFGDPTTTLENKAFRDVVGNPWAIQVSASGLRAASLDLLAAVDEGRPAGPLARTLALDVLRAIAPDTKPWLLAVAVLEGGALRMRHAVELAGVLVEATERSAEGEALCRLRG